MSNTIETPADAMRFFREYTERLAKMNADLIEASGNQVIAAQTYMSGMLKYLKEFMEPYWIAQSAFLDTERVKVSRTSLWKTYEDYLELLLFNLQVAEKGGASSAKALSEYHFRKANQALSAWMSTLTEGDTENIAKFMAREVKLLEGVVHRYPQAILDIEPEYGFHFEEPGYIKVAETDRFYLYQVLPTDRKIKVRKDGKPIIIVHPYVLGANILSFLPQRNKSYTHAFANQGIPTYIRILKDTNNAFGVQVMTGEDDVRDTQEFCRMVMDKHGRKVTLNGFCQGGFITMAEVLSGELDPFVDALITCVAPMDGTRSLALVEYLAHLPGRFRDLGYAVKYLPNGNRVVDGKVMSWVYKLKSMEKEAPVFTFFRDLEMFDRPGADGFKVSPTAAAINYWLIYDRNDLPESITKMSFDSYTIPVDSDGNLPIKLFGQKLSFKRLREKKQKVLICYAARDDLVDKATAVAPADYAEVELTEFPKGHGAIATSWSDPKSECALHTRFGPNNQRGPVRFQLDLQDGK